MRTVLFRVPEYGIAVHSFPVFLALALLLAAWLVPRSVVALTGVDRRRARIALLVVALAALSGGRLHFVLNAPYIFVGRRSSVLVPWFGGYHLGGGFIAGFAALLVVARRLGVPFLRLADGMLPPAGLCVAVGRLGCFFQGCCIGDRCDLPWGVSYPPDSIVHQTQVALGMLPQDAPRSLSLHPLQLYFALAALVVSAAMYWVARRRRYDGEVALVGFFLFWGTTAMLENLRAPWAATPLWGPLRQLHWVALVLALGFFAALVAAEVAHRGRRPVPADGEAPARMA